MGEQCITLKKGTTPVGFEPTRGDPIGLAGRRLNRSAKVSVLYTELSSCNLRFTNMSSRAPGGKSMYRTNVGAIIPQFCFARQRQRVCSPQDMQGNRTDMRK